MRRVGILGGTFDPPHLGHLIMAEEVCARLHLEAVLFVPAKEPPHKLGRQCSSIEDRLEMVKLAIEGNPHFAVSLVDIDRTGPSYSVDTVTLLQQQLGQETDLFFIIGMDSAADLLKWRDPSRLVSICHVVAVVRPELVDFDLRSLEPQIKEASKLIEVVDAPLIGISSSDIRRRVGEGLTIRYQVSKEVEGYIIEHGLYH